MNLKQAFLAGSIVAVPALASAQPVQGLYVGAGAGANFLMSEPNKGFGLPGGGTFGDHNGVNSNTGWMGEGAVGWGFGNGFRAELEADFYRNQFSGIQGIGGADGFENKYGGMVNAYYDFNLKPYGISWAQPYLGLGVGYQRNEWASVGGGSPAANLQVNNTTGGFAYQGIVGVAFPIQSAPGLAITAEYRVMDMPFTRNYNATLDTPAGKIGGIQRMGEEINQSVLLGFRYAFNAAPPPPPPAPAPAPVAAPAPAPSRTYLVFFDWDKADLTERAKQIISEAAQNSTRVQVTRIEVNGYTDTSGNPKYNQQLSVKRAQNVAAELVRDGVPESEITAQGFGDTKLLVPTAAGVREPQNRRVEIILH
jgi:OOP family OmpA-OmpF porin